MELVEWYKTQHPDAEPMFWAMYEWEDAAAEYNKAHPGSNLDGFSSWRNWRNAGEQPKGR